MQPEGVDRRGGSGMDGMDHFLKRTCALINKMQFFSLNVFVISNTSVQFFL